MRSAVAAFANLMQTAALEWAKQRAIAMPGEIVETMWGGWKRPQRVRICRVGVHVVARCRETCHYYDGQGWVAELDMTYTAQRIRKDGTSKEMAGTSGICLSNLRTDDGREWRAADGQYFNHLALSWTLAEDGAHVCDQSQAFRDWSAARLPNDAELERAATDAALAQIARLRAALDAAMATLEQIATTPRNAGAKRNASATLHFLRTQMATPNVEAQARAEAGEARCSESPGA